jgi:hypothetical protein
VSARREAIAAPATRVVMPALAVGVLALAACVVGALGNPDQFFRSYLLAFTFWNGLTVGSMAVLMLQYLTGGAWGIAIRRELEAATRTLPLTILAFLPILFGAHRLYEWTHPDAVAHDEILRKKTLYLNLPFFTVRAFVAFAAWMAMAYFLNRLSLRQDVQPGKDVDRRLALLSGGGLVVYALTVTWTSVDWVMSLEPHWYSSMYGVLYMVGFALGALALAAIAVVKLSGREAGGDAPATFAGTEPATSLSEFVGPRIRHDLGKMLFAFTMLWGYVTFSQYLIIWMGNLPEEISWYLARFRGGWGVIAWAVLLLHFAVPFLLLLSRRANRNPRMLVFSAGILFLMRFVNDAWMVIPAFSPAVLRIHWMDLVAPIGLGGLWIAFYARNLTARPLLPVHDPGFEEALAHGRE